MSDPKGQTRLTEQERERLRFLEQLMTRAGRMDNYEPWPADVREYHELRTRSRG